MQRLLLALSLTLRLTSVLSSEITLFGGTAATPGTLGTGDTDTADITSADENIIPTSADELSLLTSGVQNVLADGTNIVDADHGYGTNIVDADLDLAGAGTTLVAGPDAVSAVSDASVEESGVTAVTVVTDPCSGNDATAYINAGCCTGC